MNDTRTTTAVADRDAARAVEHHHSEMTTELAAKASTVTEAARAHDARAAATARDDLVDWSRCELVPHALAEEGTMYAAAAQSAEGRLLVEAMLAEHQTIIGVVDDLSAADDAIEAAALSRVLLALFEVHLAKENRQILPLLLSSDGVSVAELLGGMHELLGASGAHPD